MKTAVFKPLLSLLIFIAPALSFAAPTHHGIAEGIINIIDGNNEADGPFTFKLCMGPLDSFVPQNPEEEMTSVYVYKVQVYRNTEESNQLITWSFNLKVGPYWTFKSLEQLGIDHVAGNLADLSCGDQLSYESTRE